MIEIRKGGHTLTGSWTKEVWFVCSVFGESKHRKLAEAKKEAVKRGASGKWKREVRPIGPRCAKVIVYVEVRESVSAPRPIASWWR